MPKRTARDSNQSSPSTQSRRGRNNTQEESGDEEILSSPQAAGCKLSRQELKRKVADVCRFMLFSDNKKLPIKRLDISKLIPKEHSKAFPQIFEEAKKQLLNTFGFKVIELPSKVTSYVLVNKFDAVPDESNGENEIDRPRPVHSGLLIAILSTIFMSSGMITEDTLWHMLKELGLEKGKPCFFGEDPDKVISQEFVRKQYIEKKKVAGQDGPSFEFRWGPRADLEISKRSVLAFVSKLYKTNIDAWKMQYKDVLAQEENLQNGHAI